MTDSNCVTPRSFHFDPYSTTSSRKFIISSCASDCGNSSVTSIPSPSTFEEFPNVTPLHWSSIHSAALEHCVGFHPFPVGAAIIPDRDAGKALMDKSRLARLFIGQLPFLVTDEQLNHAISVATGGLVLQHIERIVNWKKNRAPTGCVHAYCMPSEVDAILSAHQRVLFDEEGVWCAWNDHELGALQDYVHRHAAQSKASGCLPSSLLTVEFARSTYVPDVRYTVKQFDGRRAVQ